MIDINELLEVIIVNTTLEIKNKLGERKIKPGIVHEILKDVLEIVEKLDIEINEKIEITIKVIENLIDNLNDDNDEKKLINEIIDKKKISNIIESKRKLDIINTKRKRLLSFRKENFVSFLKRINLFKNYKKKNSLLN